MFGYTVPGFCNEIEEIKIRFIKNKKVYNFLLKNEEEIFHILENIHTDKNIDRGNCIQLLNYQHIEIEKSIYAELKEYKSSFVEVIINSLKLGIRSLNSKAVIQKFKNNLETSVYYVCKNIISQENKDNISYDNPYDLIDGIKNDYFNPFVSLFFLPIEKKSLNFSFNPNFFEKKDYELREWIEKLILVLEEKISEIESKDFNLESLIDEWDTNSVKYFIKNKIKFFYTGTTIDSYQFLEKLENNYKKIEKKLASSEDYVELQLKNALKDVCGELKNKIKKNPEELFKFLEIVSLLNNIDVKKVSEIEFNSLEKLNVLGSKVEFMKSYCKYNKIKILIDGKEKDQDRNYIAGGIKNFNYFFLQNRNSIFCRESLREFLDYKEHSLKKTLEKENTKIKNQNQNPNKADEINIKELLRRTSTIGSYSELAKCLNKIYENYNTIGETLVEIPTCDENREKYRDEEDTEFLNKFKKEILETHEYEKFKSFPQEKMEEIFSIAFKKYEDEKEKVILKNYEEIINELDKKFINIFCDEDFKSIYQKKWRESFSCKLKEYEFEKQKITLDKCEKFKIKLNKKIIEIIDDERRKDEMFFTRTSTSIGSLNDQKDSINFRTDDAIMFFKNIIEVYKKSEHQSNEEKKIMNISVKKLYLKYEMLVGEDKKSTKERNAAKILFYKLINAVSNKDNLSYNKSRSNFIDKKNEILSLYFNIENIYLNYKKEEQLEIKGFNENINELSGSYINKMFSLELFN